MKQDVGDGGALDKPPRRPLKSDDGAETPEARDAMASAASFGVALLLRATVAKSASTRRRAPLGNIGGARSGLSSPSPTG